MEELKEIEIKSQLSANTDRYYFNNGSDLSDMATYHYWPQAHAMDVMVDAYLRTGDHRYLDIYPLWWVGAPRYNSGKPQDPWWNPYIDDMEWIALAQLRMFESAHQEKYFTKAKQLYTRQIDEAASGKRSWMVRCLFVN